MDVKLFTLNASYQTARASACPIESSHSSALQSRSNYHPVRTSDLTSSLLVSLLTIFSSPTRALSLR